MPFGSSCLMPPPAISMPCSSGRLVADEELVVSRAALVTTVSAPALIVIADGSAQASFFGLRPFARQPRRGPLGSSPAMATPAWQALRTSGDRQTGMMSVGA
jgi:hypothetical protein